MILLSIIVAIIVIVSIQVAEFNDQTYHKATGNTFFQTKGNKGLNGEYNTFKRLQFMEEYGARFLFNIYLPNMNKNVDTTEIDVIALTAFGLMVFESKNYKGWIFGDEKSTKWCQSLYGGRYSDSQKNFFFNPIKQNEGHIKSIRHILEKNGFHVPIWNIVVFSDECEIKKMSYSSKNVRVAQNKYLPRVIQDIQMNEPRPLTAAEIIKIYELLYPYSQVDEVVKQKHIADIRNNSRI